jgi:hypothetical protein
MSNTSLVEPVIDIAFRKENNISASRNDRLDAYRKAHCSAQTLMEASAFPLKNVALQVS